MTNKLNYFFVLIILISGVVAGVKPALAQEASESAVELTAPEEAAESVEAIIIGKDEGSSEESTSQILKNLESLVRDSDQSEEIINQYDDVVSKARGFIAQVSSLKDDSFKITTPGGEELLIAPDKSTTIVKNGDTIAGNEAQLSEWLAIDDWLVLIGIQNGETFQPRRILVSSEALTPGDNFVKRGIVKSSTQTKVDVAIIGEEEVVETFNWAKSTNLVDQDNETITYKDLEPGQAVLVIGEQKGTAKSLQTLRLL